MSKIRVLIVEDHPMFRQAVSLALSKSEDIEIIGETDNGKSGVKMTAELKPDVVLMDIGLPGIDGIEAAGGTLSPESNDAKAIPCSQASKVCSPLQPRHGAETSAIVVDTNRVTFSSPSDNRRRAGQAPVSLCRHQNQRTGKDLQGASNPAQRC